jgi:hypothetical protein
MKRLIAVFTFFILISFSASTNAQQMSPLQQKKVNDLYKNTSVVYFQFVVVSTQEIVPLAKIVSVDAAKGTMVRAHATKDQFSKFIVKNYAYTVMKTPPGKGGKPAPKPSTKPTTKTKTPAKKKTATTATKK